MVHYMNLCLRGMVLMLLLIPVWNYVLWRSEDTSRREAVSNVLAMVVCPALLNAWGRYHFLGNVMCVLAFLGFELIPWPHVWSLGVLVVGLMFMKHLVTTWPFLRHIVFVFHSDGSMRGLNPLFVFRVILLLVWYVIWNWLVGSFPWYLVVLWCAYAGLTSRKLEITVVVGWLFFCLCMVRAVILLIRKIQRVMGWSALDLNAMQGLQLLNTGWTLLHQSLCLGARHRSLCLGVHHQSLCFGADEDKLWRTRLWGFLEGVITQWYVYVYFPHVVSGLFRRYLESYGVLLRLQLFGSGLSLPLRTVSLRGVFTEEELKVTQRLLLSSGAVDLVPWLPQDLAQEVLEFLLGSWHAPVEQLTPVFHLEAEWFQEFRRQGAKPLPFRSLYFQWIPLFGGDLGVDIMKCPLNLLGQMVYLFRHPESLNHSRGWCTFEICD